MQAQAMAYFFETVKQLETSRGDEIYASLEKYYNEMQKAHHPRSRYITSAYGNMAVVIANFTNRENYGDYIDLMVSTSSKYGYETVFDIGNLTQGLQNFAQIYMRRGQLEKSEIILQSVSRQIDTHLPELARARITLNGNFQQLYTEKSEPDMAVHFAKKAYEIAKKRGFKQQTDLHDLHGIYANKLSVAGRGREALTEFEKALIGAEKDYTLDHLVRQQLLEGLGIELYQQGRYREAIKVFSEIISITGQINGGENRINVTSMSLLGLTLGASGRADLGLVYVNKAHELVGSVYNPSQLDHNRVIFNKAVVLSALGKYGSSNEILTTLIEKSGLSHEDGRFYYEVVQHLANNHYNNNERDQAREAFAEVVTYFESKDNVFDLNTYPQPKLAMLHLSAVDEKIAKANFTQAWQLYEKLINNEQSKFGLKSSEVTEQQNLDVPLSDLLSIARLAGEDEKAVEVLQYMVSTQVTRSSDAVLVREDMKTPALKKSLRVRDEAIAETERLRVKYALSISRGREDAQSMKQAFDAAQKSAAREEEKIREVLGEADAGRIAKPLNLKNIQAKLKRDEAVLVVAKGNLQSFVYVVSKTDHALVETPRSRREIEGLIKNVRESLEIDMLGSMSLSVFDKQAAGQIYVSLFTTDVERVLSSAKTVYVMADGAYSQLPFSILVDPKMGGDYLASRYAFVTLPSLSRLGAAQSKNRRGGFVGIGAPQLRAKNSEPVKLAQVTPIKVSSNAFLMRGSSDVEDLQNLPELPHAKAELYTIKTALGAKENFMLTGTAATEEAVRAIHFSDFDVAVFATHGLVAGALDRGSEPALVLTPVDSDASENDGLLTTSEIRRMDMNVGWVMLSACNSAAGQSDTAPGLTGLAEAFIYAGADNLLVSHWPVRDDAAAFLTVNTVKNTQEGLSKAQALQKAMVDLMESDLPNANHPAVWAPFVLVGN